VKKHLGVLPLGRSRRKWKSITKMDRREISCEDGRWMELVQYRVQWQQPLVLATLNLQALLPESRLVCLLSVSGTQSSDLLNFT
jgi:hypothetical protein